jgi:hypothetical protein
VSPKAGPTSASLAAGVRNPNGPDLALGRPVTASSSEGAEWGPGNAVDGDPQSRWGSAFSDPQWIRVDLGSPRQITTVGLSWERSYAVAYQVEVSPDGHNWKSVYRTSVGQGGTVTVNAGRVTARYVRVFGTKRALAYGYSLYSLVVH